MKELKVDHVYREKAELLGGAIAGIYKMEYMASCTVPVGEDSVWFILSVYFSLDRCRFHKFGNLEFMTIGAHEYLCYFWRSKT